MADLDVMIEEQDFPMKVKGFTVKKDDKFLILVNRFLDERRKKKAIIHEIDHIMDDDFKEGKTLQERERKREVFQIVSL